MMNAPTEATRRDRPMDLQAKLEQLARDWEGRARDLVEVGYADASADDAVEAEVYAECAAALRRRLDGAK